VFHGFSSLIGKSTICNRKITHNRIDTITKKRLGCLCFITPNGGGRNDMSSACELGLAFQSAADAWFWTMGALRARREGGGSSGNAVKRPCDPDDVVRCLDRLYRSRQIALRHARVLTHWGERQMVPDSHVGSSEDSVLWREAMGFLEEPLRVKGIVA
jgi:hypothetical protein